MPGSRTDKEKLIRKSLEVFRRCGYHHTSIADLASVCGVEKPHFYYYFKDKSDIMREVLLYTHKLIKEKIFDVANDTKLNAEERLNIILSRALKFNTINNSGCLMGNTVLETADSEPEFSPLLSSYFKDWINAFERIFIERQPPAIALRNAESSLEELQGGIMLMRLFRDENYLTRVIENIKEKL